MIWSVFEGTKSAGFEAQFPLCSTFCTSGTMGHHPYTSGKSYGSTLENHESWPQTACLQKAIEKHADHSSKTFNLMVPCFFGSLPLMRHCDISWPPSLESSCIRKLFLVRRRSFPRDAHLIHSTQETFTATWSQTVAPCLARTHFQPSSRWFRVPFDGFARLIRLWSPPSLCFGTWVYRWWRSTISFTHGNCQNYFWRGLGVDLLAPLW